MGRFPSFPPLKLFRNTTVRSGFAFEESVDKICQPGVFVDDVRKEILVSAKFMFKVSTVSEINVVLEAVRIETSGERSLEAAEEVVDFD
jgi:hypothetical protein